MDNRRSPHSLILLCHVLVVLSQLFLIFLLPRHLLGTWHWGNSSHLSFTFLFSILWVYLFYYTLPNNSIVSATHIGYVRISPGLLLHNVLCVPQFHFNLLSSNSFTQQMPYLVSFFSFFCKIHALNKDMMTGMGRRVGNLYVLNTSSLPPTVCNVSSTQHTLWHNRMGHPSLSRIHVLGSVLHFDSLKHDDFMNCFVCHLTKQKRMPTFCDTSFDLLHLDIWGPFIL